MDRESDVSRWTQVSRMSLADRIISGMTHELNQPLAAISNYAMVLRHRLEKDAPDNRDAMRDCVERIAEQIESAGDIVRRLRVFAKRADDKQSAADVHATVADASILMKAQLRARGIELESDFASDLPPAILDRRQIELVVLHLIQNAIEAIPEERKPGKIRVQTRQSPNRGAEIAVIDNGAGVSEEAFGRMFEPFFTTKEMNLGLGLAICRWIAQTHGGSVEGSRNDGEGMTFRVYLPRADQGAAT
jgi:two-component system sensor kinase FixL